MTTIDNNSEMVLQCYPAQCWVNAEWNEDQDMFVPTDIVCEDAFCVLDVPGTIALNALNATEPFWSDVYQGLDNLFRSNNVKAHELTGWNRITWDDDRHTDCREHHSVLLT